KIALYPLQHKWMLSMRKMQKLQPKMEAIKARYKKHKSDPEQRQKMNAEVMKLYQQEGINPAGGCLPMLIQLPIFYGFYEMLEHAIELRGAPWALWIHDLSVKDPTYILPILMTVAMFVQQMITPSTADPQQRRMFLIMPIIFGWIFKEFPSGLTLYWLVQNILTIVQQVITNRYWKDHPAAASNGVQEDRSWRNDSKEKISRTR
ncbi:MAG TPA: membrane protein insertase YidC, partial [Thermoanaerobaculia bacterium]